MSYQQALVKKIWLLMREGKIYWNPGIPYYDGDYVAVVIWVKEEKIFRGLYQVHPGGEGFVKENTIGWEGLQSLISLDNEFEKKLFDLDQLKLRGF